MLADELSSKATRTSGRTLSTVAAVVIASGTFGFELSSLPLLDLGELDHTKLGQIAVPMIAVLLITHLINWINDHNSHLKEYTTGTFAALGDEPNREIFLHDVKEILNRSQKAVIKGDYFHTYDKEQKRVQDLITELQEFNKPFNRLWSFARWSERISIYGQHLALPVGMASTAFYFLLR